MDAIGCVVNVRTYALGMVGSLTCIGTHAHPYIAQWLAKP
jgi:hypothetical protein